MIGGIARLQAAILADPAAAGGDALRVEMHKITGLAGTLGAERVSIAAREVEQAIEPGTPVAELAGLVAPLLPLLRATEAALKRRRGAIARAAAAEGH